MFETISRRFQLKFKDRVAAGSLLGEILKDSLRKDKEQYIVVLGVPRGGVITADSVARKLSSAAFASVVFDIIIPRKITDTDNKEHAIGAVMEDGTIYLDEEAISMFQITPAYLEKEIEEQIKEIRRRNILYSIYRPLNRYEYLEDKTVILVDDGAATGATIIAAARWLRMRHPPKRLVIAIPVAPKHTAKRLEPECDTLTVISRSSIFRSVEQFYHHFEQVPDDKVLDTLRIRNS